MLVTFVFAATDSAAAAVAGSFDFSRLLSQAIFYFFNLLFFTYLVFLWWLLVRWVKEDGRRRGVDEKQVNFYQILVLVFTLPGLLLYFFLRPPMTLDEKKRAEMEQEVLQLELEKLKREVGKR